MILPQLLALAVLPLIAPLIGRWLDLDKQREDREIAEWEAEQEAKKATDRYALAVLQPPPLLGHDGSSSGTDGDSAGTGDPR